MTEKENVLAVGVIDNGESTIIGASTDTETDSLLTPPGPTQVIMYVLLVVSEVKVFSPSPNRLFASILLDEFLREQLVALCDDQISVTEPLYSI